MNRPARTLEWVVWGGLFLVIVAIFGAYATSRLGGKPLPVLGQLPPFTLTNQNGQAVSLAAMQGKVWVVDLIFTRCPLQCLRMTKRMKELQLDLPSNPSAQLVSISIDPGFDTPAVLKEYARTHGANDERWTFLTGDRRIVNDIAVDGLKLSAVEKKPGPLEDPNDLFIHSTKFVLIDKRGQVRGYYDGEDEASRPLVLAGIKSLLREK